jgi:hypothetical protein
MGNFLTQYRAESIWDRRGARAFVLAPLVPAFAFGLFSGSNFLGAMMFAAAIAYAHVLVLGLPLVWLANRGRRISLLTSAFGAAFIGMLPWLVFISWSIFHGPAPIGGNIIVTMIFSFGFFGCMGGITGVFWWFIAMFWRSTAPVTATAP